MAKMMVHFRVDEDLKKEMNGASAVKVAGEKRIPFEVAVDPFYSEQNMARLRKSIAQMEATGGTIHEVPLDD